MDAYGRFAKLYDPLMRDVDYDAWADYLLSFLPKETRSVAECACGTGEITLRLKKAGLDVTATDVSGDMLEVASNKARNAGLNIPFICQDMRKLTLHKPVDAVICACDGVNYLATRDATAQFFHSAKNALKPGGLLLFDVSSRYKLSELLADNTFAEDDGEQAYIWRNAYDGESKLIRMELTFFAKRGELYERFTEVHIQRAHSQRELENALEKAGFETHVYAALDTKAPDARCERLQFVARKNI